MDETNDPIAEVEELVSALVNGEASNDQIRRLKELLLADNEARRLYLTCMRMHADLDYLQGGALARQAHDITGVRKPRRAAESRTLPLPVETRPVASEAAPAEEVGQ